MTNKALIAMSGGVDSSVAAFLTKDMGYDATGITLKLFDNEDIGEKREKTCCSLDDIDDARRVCLKLGIPYYVYNFKDSFKENVIDRFIRAYENGTTPNPCIATALSNLKSSFAVQKNLTLTALSRGITQQLSMTRVQTAIC